jgi:uncharacterized phage protein (TIGR01671 family)
MKEIKFRAWDKKMVYDIELIYNSRVCLNEQIEELSDRVVLMQYTGLKDINGKEIYEGDIISYTPFNKKGYKDTIAKVPQLNLWHWFDELEEMLEDKNKCDIKVIGNIFEDNNLKK